MINIWLIYLYSSHQYVCWYGEDKEFTMINGEGNNFNYEIERVLRDKDYRLFYERTSNNA